MFAWRAAPRKPARPRRTGPPARRSGPAIGTLDSGGRMFSQRPDRSPWWQASSSRCWSASPAPPRRARPCRPASRAASPTTAAAPCPASSVTIKSPALQAPQLETVSDDAGRYRFASLPGGIYTVTFQLAGFKTVTREGLRLDANFVATIDAQHGHRPARRDRHRHRRLRRSSTCAAPPSSPTSRRRPSRSCPRRAATRTSASWRPASASTASPTSAATRPAAAAARWSTTARATAARR